MTKQPKLCNTVLGIVISSSMSLSAMTSDISASASENCPTGRVVPPDEWTMIPKWSPDGRYILITWPAPPKIGIDGKLSRVIGKLNTKLQNESYNTSTILTPGPQAPDGLLNNIEMQEPLLLDANTYKRLPVEFAVVFKEKLGAVLWSPDSKLIADNLDFGTSIFDANTGKIITQLKQTISVRRKEYRWSPNSKFIAIPGNERGITLYSVGGSESGSPIPDLKGKCSSLAWSPDGKSIAFFEDRENNHRLVICSPDGKKVRLIMSLQTDGKDLGWSSDGRFFAFRDDCIHIMNTELQDIRKLEPGDQSKRELQWSPNGELLAYAADISMLKIFDAENMKQVSEISCEKNGRFRFYWSPDSKHLAITGDANEIVIIEAQTGKILGSKVFDEVSMIQWTPNGKSLCICRFHDESVLLEPVCFDHDKVAFEGGSRQNPWQNQKILKNLDDCFVELEKLMGDKEIEGFKNFKEKVAGSYGCPFFQVGPRDKCGLYDNNALVKYFNQMGIKEFRNMSELVMIMYWRKLNGKPLGMKKMAKQMKEAKNIIYPYFE